MSNCGDGEGLKLFFAFLLILIISALWFVKWLTIIVGTIVLVIVGIIKLCNKKKNLKVYEVENKCNNINENGKLFEKRIRQRGIEYYKQHRVGDLEEKGKEYSAIVHGEQDYNVKISLNENGRIKDSSCTCPYYMDGFRKCKHIYATLLKIGEGGTDVPFDDRKISLLGGIAVANTIDDITKMKKMQREEIKIEKEYNDYGLNEEEIKMVKEGMYNKWDFEEEEMEEDSYYYEDDIDETDEE